MRSSVLELELKAVVPDPDAVRLRLNAAGAVAGFRGRLLDRRFDHDRALLARDEVLRIRRWEATDGSAREELTWKGSTGEHQGYKAREEIECQLAGGAPADQLLTALGFAEVHRIDRHVELYRLGEASGRLEWYPVLDTLIEVEGTPEAIEQMIALTGIARSSFSSEPLDHFLAAYQARTGRSARLRLGDGEEPAHWPS